MTQTLPEPKTVQLALREIAEAREHLRLANDVLSAVATMESVGEAPAAVDAREGRQLDSWGAAARSSRYRPRGNPPGLTRAAGADERFKLAQVRETGCIGCIPCPVSPEALDEPVTTIVVMLAAVKFGLRHQLLLQTETRLGLAHKAPIAQSRPLPRNLPVRDGGSGPRRCALQ